MGNWNELPGARPPPVQPVQRGPEAAGALALLQQGAASGRRLCIDPRVLASSPPGSEMLVTGHVTNFLAPASSWPPFVVTEASTCC